MTNQTKRHWPSHHLLIKYENLSQIVQTRTLVLECLGLDQVSNCCIIAGDRFLFLWVLDC